MFYFCLGGKYLCLRFIVFFYFASTITYNKLRGKTLWNGQIHRLHLYNTPGQWQMSSFCFVCVCGSERIKFGKCDNNGHTKCRAACECECCFVCCPFATSICLKQCRLSDNLTVCLSVSLFFCLPVMLYLYLCIEKSCAHNISKMYWGCLQLVFILAHQCLFYFYNWSNLIEGGSCGSCDLG